MKTGIDCFIPRLKTKEREAYCINVSTLYSRPFSVFWGSQSQGSDSGRLEMKQKHFASKR
ncbi:hypothetical protein EI220_05315 [Streptococcus suis]|uniref:Uncharacterized protein n=1 Tax=Streptococcus suis TaxID=1307 RepID=A0A426G7S4_STRSU|nr:hypothetical protein EI220_05315 [Streptococcus suis]